MEIVEHAFFRVTRDADFDLSDEADDLLEAVELELRQRRFGDVVRVEVSAGVSDGLLEWLEQGLAVRGDQVYPIVGPLDLADLTQIADRNRPELKFEPWIPLTRARLGPAGERFDPFSAIRTGDLLVHLPYDSFTTSVEAFVRTAAVDPGVVGIKTTVYRTSDDSALMPALIEAAEHAKQTVCLVELKARFDEQRNIEWARAMEKAGVHVVHGFANLKIHAKTTLVVRREGIDAAPLRAYRYRQLQRRHRPAVRGLRPVHRRRGDHRRHRRPLQPPDRVRPSAAVPQDPGGPVQPPLRAHRAHPRGRRRRRPGKPARIRHQGQRADRRGDHRGALPGVAGGRGDRASSPAPSALCGPGVEGLSENIHVRSIVGRFLEHSRLFSFEAGGDHRCTWAAPT